jgi:uncharacterized protein YjbI with pentapeptide repeats
MLSAYVAHKLVISQLKDSKPPISFYSELITDPDAWNQWRAVNRDVSPINLEHITLSNRDLYEIDFNGVHLGWADLHDSNLGGADLRGADLTNTNLSGVNLSAANLAGANLFKATLRQSKLYRTNLADTYARRANFYKANLTEAILTNTDLSESDLQEAKLRRADLRGANLSRCRLLEASLEDADISNCRVYGVSAWDLNLDRTRQSDLLITPETEPLITVDDLEIAQFIYLLLNNDKFRMVIDQVTSKLVLILGRFTEERKTVLNSIRAALREYDYLPVLFDFEKPANRDTTETVGILAHMARFVVADITSPRSIPQELERIVKDLPNVPIQPIICGSSAKYGMIDHYHQYPWFLRCYRYENVDELISSLKANVIAPPEHYLKTRTLRNS